MANKLPWFTHDHSAHDDQFISESMDKFGHFGYAAYFIILELLHKDGTGDSLKISVARLCQKLRSRRTQVHLYLDFSRTSGKINFTWKSDEVEIKIKKFRERQSKMKIKIPRTLREDSAKTPIEVEVEVEVENRLSPAAKTPEIVVPKEPKKETPIQSVVRAYKHSKDVAMDNKDWDKANFGRYSKAAKNLLSCFGGDIDKCAAYIFLRAEDLNAKGLDWTLETITRHAFDGLGIPKQEDKNGSEHKPLVADRVDGRLRHRSIASSREIVGDTLRSIEHSVIRPAESADVDGASPDFVGDEDSFS